MMLNNWTYVYLLVFCFVLAGCKERFIPELPDVTTGYLVVDGIINTSAGATKFKLTRSMPLSAKENTIKPELKALLQVEGEDNAIYPLPEKGEGIYMADNLNLPANNKYRLRIKTAAGKEYLSEFTQVKKTPAIDSINWQRENSGVQLYVNTHNPQNDTRYYQWEYEETWEYVSVVDTDYKWENGMVIERMPDEHKIRCWSQAGSTSLLLGSSARLSQDIIYQQPLVFIPPASIKLSHKYSILVKQYALTKEAYEFLQTMKKNTETMGSFFDPQPSELKGNIQCLSNPNEPVIGFVSACDVVEKRIYIDRSELADWGYALLMCKQYFVPINQDSLVWYFEGKANPYPKFFEATSQLLLPQTPHCCPPMTLAQRIENKDNMPSTVCCVYVPISGTIEGWNSIPNICVDCTLRGGSTTKPDFWP